MLQEEGAEGEPHGAGGGHACRVALASEGKPSLAGRSGLGGEPQTLLPAEHTGCLGLCLSSRCLHPSQLVAPSGKEGPLSPPPDLPIVDVPGVDTAEDLTSSMPPACGGSPRPDTLAGAERPPRETSGDLDVCDGRARLLWESQSTEPKLEVSFWPPGRSEEGGMAGRCGQPWVRPPQDGRWSARLGVFSGTDGRRADGRQAVGWRRWGGAAPGGAGAEGLSQG